MEVSQVLELVRSMAELGGILPALNLRSNTLEILPVGRSYEFSYAL